MSDHSDLPSIFPVIAPPEKSLAPAVVRAGRILDMLAQMPGPVSLAELARGLQLPKSSVHVICTTLIQLRLIRRLENGLMTLGPHLMTWANAFLERSNITQEFLAVWGETSGLENETVTLSVLDGASVVYLACRHGKLPLGVTFRIGMRLPAPYTATGKAMLSTLPASAVCDLLGAEWPTPLTSAGTPDLHALMKEMQETRERGYSIDAGEIREGMHCFGAPVFDATGNTAVAGVAVSLLTASVTAETQALAGRAIRFLADRLSERMGASIKTPLRPAG